MDRRTFLATSGSALGAASLVGASGLSGCARESAPAGLERIGVQLYTVRALMAESVPATLEQVAAIGYDEVEFAGYFDEPPAQIRSYLDAHGLTAPAAHVPLEALGAQIDGTLESAQTIGHRYVILPFLAEEARQTLDDYRRVADTMNEIGERCRTAGVQFAYHNHDFEFAELDGVVPYDVLLERCDPELVQMELDLFWIAKGGYDAVAYFERAPGRFPTCHVKDMDGAGNMVDVGRGELPFGAIFAQRAVAGLRHFFVEHDRPSDPLESIRGSYAHLSTLRV